MAARRNATKLYGEYAQDHAPVVSQSEAVGHAVRGGYFYAGVADVAALTGEQAFIDAIDRIWQDVVDKKLYLIGSVGQHGAGEGYAGAYKLGNLKAYNETCAAIALALWNQRMFLLHGDAKYADVLERIIYNGFLSGVSMSGDRFFYPNPLECDMTFQVQPRRPGTESLVQLLVLPEQRRAVPAVDPRLCVCHAGRRSVREPVPGRQGDDGTGRGDRRAGPGHQVSVERQDPYHDFAQGRRSDSLCACGFRRGFAAKCCPAISTGTNPRRRSGGR